MIHDSPIVLHSMKSSISFDDRTMSVPPAINKTNSFALDDDNSPCLNTHFGNEDNIGITRTFSIDDIGLANIPVSVACFA